MNSIAWYIKLVLSTLLVFGTWNPLQYDLVHYLLQAEGVTLMLLFFIVLLIVIWGIALKALLEAMGMVGIIAYLLLTGLFIGALYQNGVITIDNLDTLGWYVNGVLTVMLFVGLMLPIWWRSLTGKVSIDTEMGE
jgi:hypothetical protein